MKITTQILEGEVFVTINARYEDWDKVEKIVRDSAELLFTPKTTDRELLESALKII